MQGNVPFYNFTIRKVSETSNINKS